MSGDGANAIQYTCNGGNNQKWRIEDQGDDTSRLVNVATGKVLGAENCSSADGADLRQWSWLNNNCRRFRFLTTDAGWGADRQPGHRQGRGRRNCSIANGGDVRQWSWLNNNCRQWRLDPA